MCRLEEERAAGRNSNFAPSDVGYTTVLNPFAQALGHQKHGVLHHTEKAKEI